MNYEIEFELQQNQYCLLQAKSKNITFPQICIFNSISVINKQAVESFQSKRIQSNRKLQVTSFIHGDNMRSLVNKINENSQVIKQFASVQNQNSFMVIGYFLLNQVITLPLPIITIGVQQDYYNFLNLYFVNSTTVELKYIYDTNNIIQKITQNIQNFQNVWISLGIAFNKVSQKAKFIYSDNNSLLHSSSVISSVTLSSSIQTLDLCFSCFIEGGVFGQFKGKFSTGKIIINLDFNLIDSYYLYNEATTINKNSILNNDFNLNSYTPNNEYDIGQGFICNVGYAFFEGVCIDKNNCQNLTSDPDTYSSFEMGKYYDQIIKKCLNCNDNCVKCSSNLQCISCIPGFIINLDRCERCSDINICSSQCSSPQLFDPMNKICVDKFNISSHVLSNLLLSSRIISDNSEMYTTPSLQINDSIVHCYIDTFNNPITLHSFFGGKKFTSSTILKRQLTQIPQGYEKSVSFYVLFYQNGTPSNLQVFINQNIVDLFSNELISDQTQCSGSQSQFQSVFKVKFIIKDYQNIFDLEIKSTSDYWGIRNLKTEIQKCHPTCNSCYEGGSSFDCASCSSGFIKNRFQCICQKGMFVKYQNCFDSQCASCVKCIDTNCLACEDITGNCTECLTNYIIKNGQCIQESQCASNTDIIYSFFCGQSQDFGFSHFQNNKIVQYADYWKFSQNNVTSITCTTKKCVPVLTLNQEHSLQIQLPHYQSYHINLNISISVYTYGSLLGKDLSFYDDAKKFFKKYYYYAKKESIDKGGPYNLIFYEAFKFQKNDNKLFFKAQSISDVDTNLEGYSLTNLSFYCERCHPLCKTCTNSEKLSCTTCIDNATFIQGSCTCMDGFYFTLDRIPYGDNSPGRCLKCNLSCKNCFGPTNQQCYQCQDGYTKVNQICLYNCSDGQYWDNSLQNCSNCHICCRTCVSGLQNQCHDCHQNFKFNIISKTCMIYNTFCQSCNMALNNNCGGTQDSHKECTRNNWVQVNTNTCLNCSQFVNNVCGGSQIEMEIEICKQFGFYRYDNYNCKSCQNVVSNSCGEIEIKANCLNNGWIIKNKNICINCGKFINGSCGGDEIQEDIELCQLYGFFNFNSKNCSSCIDIISQSCGRDEIKIKCLESGWDIFDSNTCNNCTKFVNGKCGVLQAQNMIEMCDKRGFLNYDSINCSQCSKVISENCGRSEIKERCFNLGWDRFDVDKCINCNKNSISINQCVCDGSCQTCSRYFNPTKCTSCKPQSYLFNSVCLQNCPNGFIINEQKCDPCTDLQMPTCFSYYKTCLICSPFELSVISNSCTQCSSLTRTLFNGECLCKDPEDSRQIFHECSYQTIAVLFSILSNTDPILLIDFGKQLNIPTDFEPNEFSNTLCLLLFTSQSLSLFGSNYECLISEKQITVNFGKYDLLNKRKYSLFFINIYLGTDSSIFNGDLIYFNKKILSFKASPNILIEKFMNNVVIQDKLVGDAQVVFNSQPVYNSCEDVKMSLIQIKNSAKRGFYKLKWSQISLSPSNSVQKTFLINLLQNQSKEKNFNLVILKGIIEPETYVTIQLDYTLLANLDGSLLFSFQVKQEKNVILDVQSSILYPFYRQIFFKIFTVSDIFLNLTHIFQKINRYQSGIIVISSVVKTCYPNGDIISNESFNLSITSEQMADLNYQISSQSQQNYNFQIKPYQLQVGIIILNINANLVENSSRKSYSYFKLYVSQSELYVKIKSGNGYFDYKKKLIIQSQVRDYDLPNENDSQDINIQWKCIDPSSQMTCLNRQGEEVIFPLLDEAATIESFTFDPYTVIQIVLIGEKPINRKANDTVNILLSDLDLPPLGISIINKDSKQVTVNHNEELLIQLDYQVLVNVDLLSFSGAIQYENEVVTLIKFDYITFRMKIEDYYSGFKRDQSQFQIRLSIFNPQYYMPSTNVINLNLNFPPNNCKFTITPNSEVFALETKLILAMEDCQDDNQPINYQFFFYQSVKDFEYEKKNPHKIKRRQLSDKSQNFIQKTILPFGNIILLAQAIDSKNAVFNTTIEINVLKKQYTEYKYLSVIEQTIEQSQNIQTNNAISELSIVCDDILQRPEFIQSTLINKKKIQIINEMNKLQQILSSLSTFSTVVDKAFASLFESGVTFTQEEQKEFLIKQIKQLNDNINLQQFNQEISKIKFIQKIYDSFLVLDSLGNYEKQIDETVELLTKIGLGLFQSILPNENPIYFKGKYLSIFVTQFTEKYICTYFLCQNQTRQIDNTKQPIIYNYMNKEFQNNPYIDQPSFQQCANQSENKTITSYPLIIPSIYNIQSEPINTFQESILLSFQNNNANQKNFDCLSKEDVNSQWVKSRCQSIYNDLKKQYQCVCSKLSPTTILEDFEDLSEDSNISVVTSSEGIYNIVNFKDFYNYIIFWLLLIQTIFFFTLCQIGRILDKNYFKLKLKQENLDKKNEQSQSSQKKSIPKNKNIPVESNSIQVNEELKQNIQKQKLDQQINEKLVGSSPKSMFSENQLVQNKNDQILDYNLDESIILSSQQIPIQTKNPSIYNKNSQQQKFRNSRINFILQIQTNDTNTIDISTLQVSKTQQITPSDQIPQQQLNNDDQLQQRFEQFGRLPLYKQIFVFHNFLGIFYTFNTSVSRVLRFLIFYVRSIHSFCISVIFDKSYSIVQDIIIMIINSILIMLIIKILLKVFTYKSKLGIVGSWLFIGIILFSYYYTILAIISVQSPDESNQFITAFGMFYIGDVVVIATMSAIIQKIITKYIFKNRNSQGIKKLIFNLMELQLVLQSVDQD